VMTAQWQTLRRWRLERKVRKEASELVRDVRRTLRRFPRKLQSEDREELKSLANALESAWREPAPAALRTHLANLEVMSEERLAFARKSSSRELLESIGFAVAIALLLRALALGAFKIPSGSMIPSLEIGDRIFVDKISYGLRIPGTTKRLFEAKSPARGEVIVFMNPCTPERDFIKRVVALAGDTVEVRCDVVYVNGEPVNSKFVDPYGGCSYWDKKEELAIEPWRREPCSRYDESVGDKTYSTFHSPTRPLRERQRTNFSAYTDEAGDNDFPGHRLPYCRNNLRVEPKGRIEAVDVEEGDGPCRQRRRYVVPERHLFAMGDNRAHSSDSREWGPVPLENIKGRALFIWWSSQRGIWPTPRDRPDAPLADWPRIGKTVE